MVSEDASTIEALDRWSILKAKYRFEYENSIIASRSIEATRTSPRNTNPSTSQNSSTIADADIQASNTDHPSEDFTKVP
jgi:hypothetical protein